MKKGEYADMAQTNTNTQEERYLLTADKIRIDPELFFEEDHINAYVLSSEKNNPHNLRKQALIKPFS